jgi:hypothetical protein
MLYAFDKRYGTCKPVRQLKIKRDTTTRKIQAEFQCFNLSGGPGPSVCSK